MNTQHNDKDDDDGNVTDTPTFVGWLVRRLGWCGCVILPTKQPTNPTTNRLKKKKKTNNNGRCVVYEKRIQK